jgi:hypothetical protein
MVVRERSSLKRCFVKYLQETRAARKENQELFRSIGFLVLCAIRVSRIAFKTQGGGGTRPNGPERITFISESLDSLSVKLVQQTLA